MTTFQVTETGRTWAATGYNRTTRMWRNGGPEYDVEICDDDSGETLDQLDLEQLFQLVDTLTMSERDDADSIASQAADEIRQHLTRLGDQVKAWDGEDAGALAEMLNAIDSICDQATSAFDPYKVAFEPTDYYDPTDFGWHCGEPSANTSEHIYACDKSGTYLALVVGTTDDGWTTETPEEHNDD